MTFLGQKSVKNGQLYHFLDVRKILGEADKQEILGKMSENSRTQIVFRTDIFRKLSLDAPDKQEVALGKQSERAACQKNKQEFTFFELCSMVPKFLDLNNIS